MSVSREMRHTWWGNRIFAVFASALGLAAQSGGTIAGTVSDTDGVALAQAAIQATNTATKTVYKTSSSEIGGYTLAQLPAGVYDLFVAAPGMQPFQQSVTVPAAQTLRLNIRVQDFANLNTLGDGREFVADLIARHKTPSGPTPRAADGRPDLSGVWLGAFPSDPGKPDLLPLAQSLVKQRADSNIKDFPMGLCLPLGVTMFGTFFPYRVVQTRTIVVMIDEADTPGYRQIFLDGRNHPKNLDPTWMGHSVGRWEGDTLVVDTVGFNGKAWLDLSGHPYTEKTHITERYRRPDLGHLEIEFTIEDPDAYAKPWTIKKVSDLALEDEVGEYICTENNKDVQHLVGK